MKNNLLLELQQPSGDWMNVSGYRYDRDPITITRGRSSEDTKASPGTANFTLNNTTGLFSPRNPSSPLFGLVKRNTPVRISRGTGAFGMVTSGIDQSAGRVFSNDSAAVSIVGDIDIRVDLELLAAPISEVNSSWLTGNFDYCSKFDDLDANRSWTLFNVGGKLRFTWFALGTVASYRFAESSVFLTGLAKGRRAIRVTMDVDNGAAGTTVTFYTATSLAAGNAGGWVQLGTPIVSAGTTAILDGAGSLRVGGNPVSSLYTWGESAAATFYAFELRNGIGGTVVASCDFASLPLDPTPIGLSDFTDAQGNPWGFAGAPDAARIWWGNVDVRFVGELSSLPPRWGPSHKDKYIPLVASDVLRRYQQGTSPVSTGLRDYVLATQTALLSYFPLSSQEGTQSELNLANTNKGYPFFPETFSAKPVFKYGVDMGVPWIGSGMELERTTGGYMRANTVSSDGNVAFDFVWQSNAMGGLTVSLYDYSDGVWTLDLNDIADSGLGVVSYTDPATGPIAFTSFAVPEVNDTDMHIGRLQITNNAGNVDFAVYIDGTLRKSGTQPGVTTVGSAVFRIQYVHANTGQVAINLAHLITWANANAALIPTAAAVAGAALGYAGEAAGRRIQRVAASGSLPIVFVGDLDKTTHMGVQFAESRMAQIRDAEATDFGMLATSRTANSLRYRTRQSLYNQTAALVLDYSAKVVAPPFEPVDDDQTTRNNITATRRDGGSYQVVKSSGPLAAIDPPVGIGQYEDQVDVNVETDAQLTGIAVWFLNWGTLDAARFPSVSVNLEALPQMIGQVAADALTAQVLAADLGDLLQVNNITAADIPDNLELLALGYTEIITNTTWMWTANCAPFDLYRVAVFGAGKYDAAGSVLTAAVTAGATSFQVSQTGSSIWTILAPAFPFDIYVNGERMTVTNITSATSPQTFTVTRAVNGVSKAHLINTPVRLWSTPRFAL